MNKNIIKNRLQERFLSEATELGIAITNKVQKDSKKENDDYYKEVGDKMKAYDKESKKSGKDAVKPVKINYATDAQKTYHDEYEILNGQEMLRFDNEPNEQYRERAVKAIVGDSTMGNAIGANAEATWGASSDTFGKDLIKRIKASNKKRDKATDKVMSFGDDVEVVSDDIKFRQSAIENKLNNKPVIKEEKMKRLKFKNPFNGVGRAIQLIPESYKIDKKEFELSDGNENYRVRWEGSVAEGKAVVLMASNKELVNEDMNHMKHLMGYKSEATLGSVSGAERLTENNVFGSILDKTKKIVAEGGVAGFANFKPNAPVTEVEEIKQAEVVEEAENNPWAICTASVGREDKEKFEKCVLDVKKEKGITESAEEGKSKSDSIVSKEKWQKTQANAIEADKKKGK